MKQFLDKFNIENIKLIIKYIAFCIVKEYFSVTLRHLKRTDQREFTPRGKYVGRLIKATGGHWGNYGHHRIKMSFLWVLKKEWSLNKKCLI